MKVLALLILLILLTTVPAAAQLSDEAFEPYPEKVDLLVVVSHPDDESTFGGLIPYYATCQQKSVVFVCMTSGEWGNGLPHHSKPTDEPDYSYDDSDYPRFEKVPADALYPCYYREGELVRMLQTVGVRTKPVLPRFKDMSGLQPWGTVDPAYDMWGGRDKVIGYITSQIRRFRPDVIVVMAKNGYNNNPVHMASSNGTLAAVKVSGDDAKYPEQLAQHAAWTPKKLYMHAGPGEEHQVVHSHSWELGCNGQSGRARVLAARGNAMHESQEMKEECPKSTDFVLQYTTVGPDLINANNLFENVR